MEAVKWGNPQYRRFDDGKKSLLGSYTTAWADDSQAFFTENGTFKTEYIGSVRRAAWGNTDPVPTTHVDYGSFTPNAFDISESNWYQRNIPKRFSNAANASVQFTIPAGYSKFDFIYHAHVNADIITITTNRNNGIVKMSDVQNNWNNAIEANASTKDLSAFNTGEGDDTYGVPNKRLHFQISDTSVATIVTINKSSATDKYIIYWGVTYWGTSALPYAFHLDVMAIGGHTMQAIYSLRGSMLKATNPDAILLEICFNNLNNSTFSAQMQTVADNLDFLKSYLVDVSVS